MKCQERIADEFLDKLVKWTKNIKISDPFEEGCRLGPVVSKGQVKLLNRIDILKNKHLNPPKPSYLSIWVNDERFLVKSYIFILLCSTREF